MTGRKGTTAKATDNPFAGLSVQGEQQARRGQTLYATDNDVALRAQSEEDGVVACRERGRHEFPSTRASVTDGPPFTDITDEGFYVRRIPCPCCRHVDEDGTPGLPRVVRVETWDLKHRRGKILPNGAQIVSSRTVYVDRSYLADKGTGRTKPRQWRNAAMGPMFAGQSIVEVKRAILDARDERERLAAEAYARSLAPAEPEGLRAVPDTA
ncbi:MAG TPA: hypothetical protein VIU11_14335 [Nakamurella sp.]